MCVYGVCIYIIYANTHKDSNIHSNIGEVFWVLGFLNFELPAVIKYGFKSINDRI